MTSDDTKVLKSLHEAIDWIEVGDYAAAQIETAHALKLLEKLEREDG